MGNGESSENNDNFTINKEVRKIAKRTREWQLAQGADEESSVWVPGKEHRFNSQEDKDYWEDMIMEHYENSGLKAHDEHQEKVKNADKDFDDDGIEEDKDITPEMLEKIGELRQFYYERGHGDAALQEVMGITAHNLIHDKDMVDRAEKLAEVRERYDEIFGPDGEGNPDLKLNDKLKDKMAHAYYHTGDERFKDEEWNTFLKDADTKDERVELINDTYKEIPHYNTKSGFVNLDQSDLGRQMDAELAKKHNIEWTGGNTNNNKPQNNKKEKNNNNNNNNKQ